MKQISIWKNYILGNVFDKEDKILLDELFKVLETLNLCVGDGHSSWSYPNSDKEYRANIYYKNIAFFKMHIRIKNTLEGESLISILRPRRREQNTVKLNGALQDNKYSKLLKKDEYNIERKDISDLILTFENLIDLINNFFEHKNVSKFEDITFEEFWKSSDFSLIDEYVNLEMSKFENVNKFYNQIFLEMKNRNILRISGNRVNVDIFDKLIFDEYRKSTLKRSFRKYTEIFYLLLNFGKIYKESFDESGHVESFVINNISFSEEHVHGNVNHIELIDVTNKTEKNKFTLFIGNNGSGKTNALSDIHKIFLYLQDITYRKNNKRPLFTLQYTLDGLEYSIFSQDLSIKYYIGSEEVTFESIKLPTKMIVNSNLINDRFTFRTNEDIEEDDIFYSYLGIRSSGNAAHTSTRVKNTLLNLLKCYDQQKAKSQIDKLLKFMGFEKKIKISFSIKEATSSSISFPMNLSIDKDNLTGNDSNVISFTLSFDENVQNDIDKSLYEQSIELIRNGNVTDLRLDVFKGNYFNFEHASSGENNLLYTMINLIVSNKKKSLILIDEPEVSLHPAWQYKYIKLLDEIFSDYGCHFIIATHSHFLVSSLIPNESCINHFYSIDNRYICEQVRANTYGWSPDEILYTIFKIYGTRNYYVDIDVMFVIKALEIESKEFDKLKQCLNRLSQLQIVPHDPLAILINEAKEYLEKNA